MKMIAIVVPCFNEEKRINISKWQNIVDEFTECHWIFVNDGSSDRTGLLISQLYGDNLSKLELPTNRGKGNAIRDGFNHVIKPPHQSPLTNMNFSKIGYIDSDGAFDLSDIHLLFCTANEKMGSDSAYKVVIGSRVKLAGRQIQRNQWRHYLGRLISTFICLGWERAPYDTQSGFKIFTLDSSFRKAVLTPFRTSWFFDIELILRLESLGSSGIWEVPLMKWEEVGQSSIKSKNFLNILLQILTIRFLVKSNSEEEDI